MSTCYICLPTNINPTNRRMNTTDLLTGTQCCVGARSWQFWLNIHEIEIKNVSADLYDFESGF